MITQQAQTRPEALALLAGEAALSYRELDQALDEYAGTLQEAATPRIAFPAPATLDSVLLLLGVLRAQGVVCPMNPQFPQAVQEEVARHCALRRPGAEPLGPSHTAQGLPGPATIVLSSGSMGTPKAIVLGMENYVAAAHAANANLPLGPGDRWLLSLPLYHVAGIAMLFRCFRAGAAVAIPRQKDLGEALRESGATHVSLVATQLQRLLREPRDLETLRGMKAIVLGGGPVPAGLARRAHALGLPVHKTYGMTETAGQITATPPGATLDELLTAGRPLVPGTVRVDAHGEIQVRGEALFLGYWDGEHLRRPLDHDGFFATGDLGAFDAAGNLVVQGRKDNMFISGGENIYPEEIERALMDFPQVEQALVVPLEDAEFGARAVAFVAWEGGASPKVLEEALSDSLPRFKVPRLWLPWPQQIDRGLKPSRVEFRRIAAQQLHSCEGAAAFASQEPGYV